MFMARTSGGLRRPVGVRRLAVIAGSAVALGFVGCSTLNPPDRDDTLRTIDKEWEELRRKEQQEIKNCNGDPDCIKKVREDFYKLRQDLNKLKQKVIEEDWEDARDARKKLRDRIIDLIPKYPDLKEFLEWLLKQLDEEKVSADLQGVPTSIKVPGGPKSAVGDPLATVDYAVSGKIEIFDWSLDGPVQITGPMNIDYFVGAAGVDGTVNSGSLTLALGNGSTLTAPLYQDPTGNIRSSVSVDSAGVGYLTLAFDIDSNLFVGNWGAVAMTPSLVRIPVVLSPSYKLTFYTEETAIADLFPYEAFPASDYDGDGLLDPEADYAAFTIGIGEKHPLADIDADGDWDQDDVDMWWSDFLTDYAHQ